MSEYLTYQLWKQREERMPDELEHQRVVEERMRDQQLERELEAATSAHQPSREEYVLVDE
jgi:hypothetical protein